MGSIKSFQTFAGTIPSEEISLCSCWIFKRVAERFSETFLLQHSFITSGSFLNDKICTSPWSFSKIVVKSVSAIIFYLVVFDSPLLFIAFKGIFIFGFCVLEKVAIFVARDVIILCFSLIFSYDHPWDLKWWLLFYNRIFLPKLPNGIYFLIKLQRSWTSYTIGVLINRVCQVISSWMGSKICIE